VAVKAAIKDQEVCGLDILTDGELRRDNMIDYFAERLPGVQTDHSSKKFYYDFYDSVVRGKLPMASLRLSDDFKFLAAFTDRATKFCVTGPHSLVKRIKDEYYKNEQAFAMDLARIMNMELKELARAGARYIQIDEPYYSGFPEDLQWGVKVLNTLVDGVDAKIALHVCYGNRYGKPSWAGNYRYLFPTILEANIQQLTLEFARRGGEDLELFKEFPSKLELGVGVIDVKTHEVETPEIVAERLRKALKFMPAERLFALPDCGCLHLPQEVAFAKLRAMVHGTRIVRKELGVS
jgi:5-methyltetrahydropteroyltriglutamate--homocysteine methyltransferase